MLVSGLGEMFPRTQIGQKRATTLWSRFGDHGTIFATPHTVSRPGDDQKTVAVFERVLERRLTNSATSCQRVFPRDSPKCPQGKPRKYQDARGGAPGPGEARFPEHVKILVVSMSPPPFASVPASASRITVSIQIWILSSIYIHGCIRICTQIRICIRTPIWI